MQWHSAGHIIMRFIPDTQQPPLAQHCGSLKLLSLWNVPDLQRNKELFRGRQTEKTVCKPAEGRPASQPRSTFFDQGFCWLVNCSTNTQTAQQISSSCILQYCIHSPICSVLLTLNYMRAYRSSFISPNNIIFQSRKLQTTKALQSPELHQSRSSQYGTVNKS